MLQRSPEYQKRLAESEHTEAKAIKHEHRRAGLKARAYGALVLGLFISAPTSAYAADVHANQEIQAEANIDISLHGQALDPQNNHRAIVYVDGFRSYDSTNLTQYMSKATQPVFDGQLWSLDYNNAFLNAKGAATEITALAKQRGVDQIVFVDYSAGGDFTINVEKYVMENPDITVTANVMESVPNGAGGLRTARQDEVALVEKLKHIPGVQYSTPARFIGEMAFRAESYTTPLDSENPIENIKIAWDNVSSFLETAGEVHDALKNKDTPGTWLMSDQILAIENANFEDRIKEIGKLPDTAQRPLFVYVGTGTPGYDYMVDDKKSAQEIGSYAAAAEVPFMHIEVPNAVHSRPDLANKEYIQSFAAVKEQINAAIDQQAALAETNQALAAQAQLFANPTPTPHAVPNITSPPDAAKK